MANIADNDLEALLQQRLAELRERGASKDESDYAVAAANALLAGDQEALTSAAQTYHDRMAEAEAARLRLREHAIAAGRSGMPISQLHRLTGVGRITLTAWVKRETP